ncbi:GOLPH3/VPS74 family protein [Pseudonocardia sichuanensis]|uniref:Golgi phosphoprotein 3 GPP34 n=1 Tax=Pseudonocardia kunmingensis TaxID=630975 RepID=A0A543D140_9PSEU|nr:GPP34 family phosphoprotein [Pseudonocardia kunmingensis]TQM03055.1 Golgi phosphoprotein 3 GPP34 [Pseudonocardia kunmingensis]
MTGPAPADPVSRDKLAARMFLILHDPFTGKALVRASAVRIAVAGAELADLALARPGRGQLVALENDRVVLAGTRPRRLDYISSFVVDSIRSQPEAHSATVWTAALADHVFDLVLAQLITEGVVQRQQGGLFGRSSRRFPAVDLLAAAGPRVRLEHALRSDTRADGAGAPDDERALDEETAVLLAVLAAVGGERTLDLDRAARRRLTAAAADALPLDLRNLVTGIEVAHASGELPQTLRLRTSDK